MDAFEKIYELSCALIGEMPPPMRGPLQDTVKPLKDFAISALRASMTEEEAQFFVDNWEVVRRWKVAEIKNTVWQQKYAFNNRAELEDKLDMNALLRLADAERKAIEEK